MLKSQKDPSAVRALLKCSFVVLVFIFRKIQWILKILN